jgi:Mlc titration factor MtfA (ptsG expression regulator)
MIFEFLTQRKRRNVRARPFPSAWKSIITRNVPIFRRLPPADQKELLGCVQIFLAEKQFEGCGGLELTDEIRVTIAAQACLLLLHRETDYYPELTSILVYPSAYIAHEDRYLGDNIWERGWLNVSAKVIGLCGHSYPSLTTRDGRQHVPPVGAITSHL